MQNNLFHSRKQLVIQSLNQSDESINGNGSTGNFTRADMFRLSRGGFNFDYTHEAYFSRKISRGILHEENFTRNIARRIPYEEYFTA